MAFEYYRTDGRIVRRVPVLFQAVSSGASRIRTTEIRHSIRTHPRSGHRCLEESSEIVGTAVADRLISRKVRLFERETSALLPQRTGRAD